MTNISKKKECTDEVHEFMELNPMHATFDARKIRSTFLFDETSVDELQDLSQSALSPVSEMKDVEAARKIKISSSPYYAPLRNPDGSLYHSLSDDHAKVSGFSIPLVSANESLKDHQGFYAFLPSEDKDDARVKPLISEDLHLQPSNISVALVGERLLYEPTTINEARDVYTANNQIEIASAPYYAPLRNPDGSLYHSLNDDHVNVSGFSIPLVSAYEGLKNHQGFYVKLGAVYDVLQRSDAARMQVKPGAVYDVLQRSDAARMQDNPGYEQLDDAASNPLVEPGAEYDVMKRSDVAQMQVKPGAVYDVLQRSDVARMQDNPGT
jgi:hypothetical protein